MAATKALSQKDMNGQKIVGVADGTAAQDAATKAMVDAAQAFAVSRANHTGAQLAATVSDFDTQVRTSRLDQMAAPTGPVAMNTQKITGLLDPAAAQDAATRNYVDTQLAGVLSGQVMKGEVRVAVAGNVDLAAPGATLDGVALDPGDLFLAYGQTTPTENGPYTWNGAAVAATRAANWNTDAEAVRGSYWVVREGTKADQFALLTNDVVITLGTSTPTFTFIAAQAGGVNGYTTTCPAVAGGATWTVTHNLNSKFVVAQVARVASPYDFVDVRVERATVNTLAVLPDVAIGSGEFEIMVYKVA
jgi:hypothetical protein